MYKVIKEFTDMISGQHYKVGDTFPAEGVKVDAGRLAKLASENNRQKTPLIEEIKKNSAESLNSAIPSAQPEKVEQEETPVKTEKKTTGRRTAKKN